MNTTYLDDLIRRLRENYHVEEDDLEEASNSTDAYAGGEGPQKTPFAFGGSDAQKRKKFGKKSAVYDKPVEESDEWFVKMENHHKRITTTINEISFVSAIDTRQIRSIVKDVLNRYGLAIFSSKIEKSSGSRIGLKFILYNPTTKFLNQDDIRIASDAISNDLESYSNVSSVNLRFGRTSNGFYPYIIIYLRRIGRNESTQIFGNNSTSLDGGGLSTGAQISSPKLSGEDPDILHSYDGEEFEDDYEELHFESVLNEVKYQDYVSDDSLTDRQKINKTIKEINTKLREVEQLIKHSQKFKNEIGADSTVFYKDTILKFGKIAERLKSLQAKIREFNT